MVNNTKHIRKIIMTKILRCFYVTYYFLLLDYFKPMSMVLSLLYRPIFTLSLVGEDRRTQMQPRAAL